MTNDGEAEDERRLPPVHRGTRLFVVVIEQEFSVTPCKLAKMALDLSFSLLFAAGLDKEDGKVWNDLPVVVASVSSGPVGVSHEPPPHHPACLVA